MNDVRFLVLAMLVVVIMMFFQIVAIQTRKP